MGVGAALWDGDGGARLTPRQRAPESPPGERGKLSEYCYVPRRWCTPSGRGRCRVGCQLAASVEFFDVLLGFELFAGPLLLVDQLGWFDRRVGIRR